MDTLNMHQALSEFRHSNCSRKMVYDGWLRLVWNGMVLELHARRQGLMLAACPRIIGQFLHLAADGQEMRAS